MGYLLSAEPNYVKAILIATLGLFSLTKMKPGLSAIKTIRACEPKQRTYRVAEFILTVLASFFALIELYALFLGISY